jgi:acetyltransferase-like isoleucine patch superfamily enzyme
MRARNTPAVFLGHVLSRVWRIPSVLWYAEAKFKGAEFLGSVDLVGRPIISLAANSRIVVGDAVKMNSMVRGNPLGLSRPSVLRTLAPGAEIILGTGVGLSGAAICAGLRIEVGDHTIIGAGAMIMDNDFHQPIEGWKWSNDSRTGAEPIKIGRGVFIGANAIILKGVTIGDRALIGAGAVVAKDVPDLHIAAGNPARILPAKGHVPRGS